MNNSSKIIIPALVLALFAVPVFARGNGNGNGGGRGNGGQQRSQTTAKQCDGSGPRHGDRALCDGSGPGQGTPRRDGSGKALNDRGNPNSTGTPLRDGSGRSSAPGQGAKDGSGNNPDCPLASGS
ncbi:MAG TPA: hypothetical protein PK322_00145 [Opitutaceae bacterium]|nr:hypothetical protein [Opitutaceae bacterium]